MPTLEEVLARKAKEKEVGGKLTRSVNQSDVRGGDLDSILQKKAKEKQIGADMSEEFSALSSVLPAFAHGLTIGAYKPENYEKLVKAHPWITGISDFAGSAIPITAISLAASPVAGAGMRATMGVSAAAKGANLAAGAIGMGTTGMAYEAVKESIAGKPAKDVAKSAATAGLMWGAMHPAFVGASKFGGKLLTKAKATKLEAEVTKIRSNLVKAYEQKIKDGDEQGANVIKTAMDRLHTNDAGSIAEGTNIPIYGSGVNTTALVKYSDSQKMLGEAYPAMLDPKNFTPEAMSLGMVGTKRDLALAPRELLFEAKNNIKESHNQYNYRKGKIFYSLYDSAKGEMSDAFLDKGSRAVGKNIKLIIKDGEVKVVEVGKKVGKEELSTAINNAVTAADEKFFSGILYGESSLAKDLFSLDVDKEMLGRMATEGITTKGMKQLAESKGLRYFQPIGNNGDFKSRVFFNNETSHITFADMKSANEFLMGYKKGMTWDEIEKLQNITYARLYSRSPELVSNKYKTEVTGAIRIKPEPKKTVEPVKKLKRSTDIERPREVRSIKKVEETGKYYREIIERQMFNREDSLPPIASSVLDKMAASGYSHAKDIGIWDTYFAARKIGLETAEAKSKLPVFSKLYEPMEQAMKLAGDYNSEHNKIIDGIFNGIKKNRRKNIVNVAMQSKDMIRPGRSYNNFKKMLSSQATEIQNSIGSITESEYASAIRLRELMREKFTEAGMDADRFIEDYVSMIRKSGKGFTPASLEGTKANKNYMAFFEHLRTGGNSPYETDPSVWAKSYINALAKKKFLAEPFKKGSQILDDAAKKGSLPTNVNTLARGYLNDAMGWSVGTGNALDTSARDIASFLNKQLHKVGITKWAEEDVDKLSRDLVGFHMSTIYSGAMGFRPYTVIRNTFQTLLTTLPKLGPKYTMLGIKDAMKKETWDAARSAGILVERYSPIPGGEYLGEGAIERFSKASLWGYRKADSFNRVIAWSGAKRIIDNYGKKLIKDVSYFQRTARNEKHLQKLIDRRMEKFINQTEIDWLHQTVLEKEIVPLIKAGRIQELGDRFARHMAEETQWIYRKANSPHWMRGNLGRVGGQFGLWPTWYIHYARSLTRGKPWNVAKRFARLGAVGTLTTTIGANVFGVDIHNWVFHHPMMWSGAPTPNAIMAAHTMVGGSEYDKARSKRIIENYAGISTIPGFLAFKGLFTAFGEKRDEDMIKRALGFKPLE